MIVKLTLAALVICIAAGAQTLTVRDWFVAGTNPRAYELTLDRGFPHAGNASAKVQCRTHRCPAFATLMQTIQADEYMGRRVRLSGWVKATKGVSARLWMRMDGENGETLAFDNMDNRARRGPFE